jgi:pyruvate dehydrogenase E1 component alpha subunit
MGTDVRRVSAEPEIHKRACAYNIPAERVDGMDLPAVREAARRAVEWVRAGKGPYFLEAVTYRFRGHSMADPEFYRDKDEVQRWKAQDPIVRFRRHLEEEGLISEEEAASLQEEVETAINDAVRFAEESPEPGLEALHENVYKE